MADNRKKSSSSEFAEVSRGISMILQIGISMMVPIGLCLFVGYELDRWLSTGYMIIIFLFLGIAAGVRSVYMMVRRFYEKDLERENEEQKYYKELYEERDRNKDK